MVQMLPTNGTNTRIACERRDSPNTVVVTTVTKYTREITSIDCKRVVELSK